MSVASCERTFPARFRTVLAWEGILPRFCCYGHWRRIVNFDDKAKPSLLMSGSIARPIVLAAAGVLLISSCSGPDAPGAVGVKDLQRGLVDHLATTGTPSTWVTCAKALPGRVGATTRCDVTFSTGNTVTALLTTTEVDGEGVGWEITGPEFTKDQVAQRIAGLTASQSANCDSGLDGRPGDWVQCRTTRNGVTLNQTVEVKETNGLSVNLALTPAIPQKQTEDLLRNKLAEKYGLAFETAMCPGDLVGDEGVAMDCVATSSGRQQTYTLVVTDIGNGALNFEVAEPEPPAALVPGPLPVVVAPQPAPVAIVPQPAPVAIVPQPAPVVVAPSPVLAVPLPEPEPPQAVLEPAPVEGVPHLPFMVPHLPPGEFVPAPGPVAAQTDAGLVVAQAAGG